MKLFGKKKNAEPTPAKKQKVDLRLHNEGLGQAWHFLTGMDPAQLIPQVAATVLNYGGTRPPWKWKRKGQEFIAVAWPEQGPVRACVLMSGPEGGQLAPVTVVPLLEGLPNDLTVEEVHPRNEGHGADVASLMVEGQNPMWFFDPFYSRDAEDLTPGVTHTFWFSGIAFGMRKAALDEITLVQGPQYEEHAAKWLKEHPGSQSQDVPPLKIEIKGKHFIMPGRFFGEYQFRAPIEKIEDCMFEKMPVKICYLNFPFDNRQSLRVPLFTSDFVLGDYKPQTGDEIEAYAWLQGRIIDLEAPDANQNSENPDND